VQEDHHVGVLFEGARLAQVAHLRLLVGALFRPTVELGDRDHRDLEFLGEKLERPGELADLLLT